MTFERGQEVYVLFEGVFALDETVDATTSNWIIVRTSAGMRVELPIEAVAEWDVETIPPRPSSSPIPTGPQHPRRRFGRQVIAGGRDRKSGGLPMPARLLRRA